MAQSRTFPFTDDKIAALPLPRQTVEYADTVAAGLRLRVGKTGTRTFTSYGRDANGKRVRNDLGRWSSSGTGGTYNVASARLKFLGDRGEAAGLGNDALTVSELLQAYEEREQVSEYTLACMKKHIGEVGHLVAATLAPSVLPDLVAKVQKGYVDENDKEVGGPAIADKVRSGLASLFEWAQRQGRFPGEKALPTLGLVREDFKGIGWKPKLRFPSEKELHQLFDALGVGTGKELTIDMKVNPRITLASRLGLLLLMHVPVRSGVGVIVQPASAVDTKDRVLRWETHKGSRSDRLETPLSDVAVEIVEQLRKLPGGDTWLVPSPENPKTHIDLKVLNRTLKRLQEPSAEGKAPRVVVDDGKTPFTPHALRALWSTLAGEIGIADGVAVRVIGHKPKGASDAQTFYDQSERVDHQRDAVERVSAELERLRRRRSPPAKTKPLAKVIRLR